MVESWQRLIISPRAGMTNSSHNCRRNWMHNAKPKPSAHSATRICLQKTLSPKSSYCWWFRNPAPVEGTVVYPIKIPGLKRTIPKWWPPDFFHQQFYWKTSILESGRFHRLVPSSATVIACAEKGVHQSQMMGAETALVLNKLHQLHSTRNHEHVMSNCCSELYFWPGYL